MHPTRRPRLEEVMAGLAARDLACLWALVTEFGDELARPVRSVLIEMGRRDVLAEPGRVEGMVLDIALHLFDHGARWSPTGGALPWVWADRAVRSIVARDVGHRGAELEHGREDHPQHAEPHEVGVPAPEPTLDELAAVEPTIGLLAAAMARVGSDRDRAVHVEYGIQRAAADPSPAHTVAELFGLKPDNVRQIDHRMKGKLRHLAETDEEYRDLGGLRWLA